LAQALKRVRPELDLYLVSNGRIEGIAGDPKARAVRRIFYAVEELLEMHLAILEGVQDRYDTPFFNNLKKYAQRPSGTFHALPIARGKSIFKSDWIGDMGEFWSHPFPGREQCNGRPRQPAGADRQHQKNVGGNGGALFARHAFFVTNGPPPRTRWRAGAARARRIAIVDRTSHKSHHYGMVLAGAQPLMSKPFR
jgi:arginine decarboxylase